MTAAETALFAIARTLTPARDGSTPVFALDVLEAVRDRLEYRSKELAEEFTRADEQAEVFENAGAPETAAVYTASAKAAFDKWWEMQVGLQRANDEIKEWLGIALKRAAA